MSDASWFLVATMVGSVVLAGLAFFAISLWRRTTRSLGGIIALMAGVGLALTAAGWFTGVLISLAGLLARD